MQYREIYLLFVSVTFGFSATEKDKKALLVN